MSGSTSEVVAWIFVPAGTLLVLLGIMTLVFRERMARNMGEAGVLSGCSGSAVAFVVVLGVVEILLGFMLSIGVLWSVGFFA